MNDQSESPKVWASQGEWVTCVNGHPICEIAHTIYVGHARSERDFCNWKQPEPDRKTSVAEIRCVKCKGVWVRGNNKEGYQFHFGAPPAGDWR